MAFFRKRRMKKQAEQMVFDRMALSEGSLGKIKITGKREAQRQAEIKEHIRKVMEELEQKSK